MSMDGIYIGSIVATSLLMFCTLVVVAFLYSYHIYTKNRLFTKPKLSLIVLIISSILIVVLIAAAIVVIVKGATSVGAEKQKYTTIGILLLVSSLMMLGDLIAYIIITKNNAKGKIDYTQVASINWNAKIDELKASVDIEQLKAKLNKRKYYQRMLNDYKEILILAKDSQKPDSDKLADIVVFNENYTHKWSKTNNNLQLLLTYEFLKIFNK